MPRYLFEIAEEHSRPPLHDTGREALRRSMTQALGREREGLDAARLGAAAHLPSVALAGLSVPTALSRVSELPDLALSDPELSDPELSDPELSDQQRPDLELSRLGRFPAMNARGDSGAAGGTITFSGQAAPERAATRRRKLWEIDPKYHCPLIGTCLSVDELRGLAERHAHRPKERLSDYALHVSFVTAVKERNGLALAAHKRLDKKYAADLRRLGKTRDLDQLRAYWDRARETGEVAGALWALLSHPLADDALGQRLYEDVHMLSHQIGAGQRADARRLHQAQTELTRARQELADLRKRGRQQIEEREREIQRLTRALEEKTKANNSLQARVDTLTAQCAKTDTRTSAQRLAAMERKLVNQQARLVRIQDEREHWRLACAEAERQCEQSRTACQEAEANARALAQQLAALLDDDTETTTSDLGGRQVLCVGGRLGTVEQYRALVGRCNGAFAHHDGGMEDNQNRLETMLAAADLVICTTEFVSHDAYRRTKRFCKQHAKPHVLLPNSGLGSFSRALEQLARVGWH